MDWRRLLNEPVMLMAVIRAAVVMLAAFGFELSPAQVVAVYGFTEALLTWLTRAMVVPNQIAEARVAAGGSPTTPLTEEQKQNLRTRNGG